MHTAVASVPNGCDACHEAANIAGASGNLSFQGVLGNIYLRPNNGTNSGKSNAVDAAHPATGDCGGCHTTAPPFSNATSKPAGHIATATNTCSTCHTTAGVFTNVVLPMPHTGAVSGTCASCHNTGTFFAGSTFTPNASGGGGTFGTQTSGLNFQPKQIIASPAVGAAGGHIPLPSGDDCNTCHTSFSAFGPGTAMVHTGISSNCAQCHAAGSKWYGLTYIATPLVTTGNKTLSPLHVPIAGAACEKCHSVTVFTSFGPGSTVNHTSGAFMTYTRGNGQSNSGTSTPKCVTCHAPSGTTWYGVSLSTATMGSHQGSSNTADCIDCHSATGGSFGGAAAAAAAMHRPVQHTAGPAARPGTHLPMAGLPFSHVGVIPGGCVSCHSPTGGATARPGNHLPTNLSCDNCHRTSTWLPALFSHNGVTPGTCGSCHAPGWATAKPASHMLTSRTCDTCHAGTAAWTPQTYTHLDTIYTPHSASVSCTACHATNTEQVVWKYPNLKPGCAGCHGAQFPTATVRRSKGPAITPQRTP